MKLGVTLSGMVHVGVLSWGLLTLSAPTPLEVADIESISVDVVPFQEIVETVQGDKEADLRDTPAPTPTKRPVVTPEAKNVGETKVDKKTVEAPKPTKNPTETVKAEAPPPAPIPTPKPEVAPEPTPAKEEAPAPTTELAALTQPAVPVTETVPVEDAVVTEEGEQFAKLPDTVPAPVKRPEAPKPKSAETTSRKDSKEAAKKETATSDSKDKSKTDDLAALINKDKPKASGAKASKKQASLGTKKPAKGEKLTRSEMGVLRDQLAGCWSIPAGISDADGLRVSVEFEVAENGKLKGSPKVTKSSNNRQFDRSAVRAIQKCNNSGLELPKGKFETWREVQVNFDPSEMF